MVDMVPVTSSNVSSVGYDSGTLYVEFNNGSTYAYDNVPEGYFLELRSASSVGGFLNNHIKGHYPHRRV